MNNAGESPVFWLFTVFMVLWSGWLLYSGDIFVGLGGLFFVLVLLFVSRWIFAVMGFWFMLNAVFLMHTVGYKWNYELGFLAGALMLHLGIESAYKRP